MSIDIKCLNDKEIGVRTSGMKGAREIWIGSIGISMKELCEIVLYALTNVGLDGPDDPRLKLISTIKWMTIEERDDKQQWFVIPETIEKIVDGIN